MVEKALLLMVSPSIAARVYPTTPYLGKFEIIVKSKIEIIVKSPKLSRSRTVIGCMVQHYATIAAHDSYLSGSSADSREVTQWNPDSLAIEE